MSRLPRTPTNDDSEATASGARRDFVVWVAGTTADSLGNTVVMLALPLAILGATGSSALAGGLTTLYSGTFAALVLLGGVLVDRVDRRRAMLVKSAIGLLLWGVLSELLQHGLVLLPVLAALLVLAGANRALFGSADNAALRSIVPGPRLARAQGVVQAREAAVELAGSPLGGLLLGLSIRLPFLVAAACSVVLGAAAILIRTDLRPSQTRAGRGPTPEPVGSFGPVRTILNDLREGFVFVWSNAVIRHAIIVVAIGNAAVSLTLQLATLSFGAAGIDAFRISLLYASAAGAMLIGALYSGRLVSRVRNGMLVVAGFVVVGLALLAISVVPTFTAVLVAFVVVGLVIPTTSAVLQGYVAWATPPDRQGRVISLMTLVSLGLAALTPLAAGVFVHLTVTWLGYGIAAVLGITCASVAAGSRRLRALGSPDSWARDEGAPD